MNAKTKYLNRVLKNKKPNGKTRGACADFLKPKNKKKHIKHKSFRPHTICDTENDVVVGDSNPQTKIFVSGSNNEEQIIIKKDELRILE